jgi:ligand-binding sensor domain-containing protein
MNPIRRSVARSLAKRHAKRCSTVVCVLQLSCILAAAEPRLVKLAVTEGTQIRFAHLTARDGLPPGTVRNILQNDQGFLWFSTSNALVRYDGYKFKTYRRDPTHPNYPAGGFLHYAFKDRSGLIWVGSHEALERFDPATETLTRFAIDRNSPRSLLGPVRHISQAEAVCSSGPEHTVAVD